MILLFVAFTESYPRVPAGFGRMSMTLIGSPSRRLRQNTYVPGGRVAGEIRIQAALKDPYKGPLRALFADPTATNANISTSNNSQ